MLKAMIERPIIVFLIVIMVSIAGMISAVILPIQILPKLDAPFINVTVILENETDLDKIEQDIVTPLENASLNAPGVREVEANVSSRSVSMTVHLKDGAKESEIDLVIEELNRQLGNMTLETRRKEVKQYSTADNTFMAIAIVPNDINDVSVRNELINNVIPELSMLSEVRSVEGALDGYDNYYDFVLKSDRPLNLQSSVRLFEELKGTFESTLLGSLNYGGDNYRVKTESSVQSIDEVAQYRLANGEIVADRFEINEAKRADDSYIMYNGAPYYEINIKIASTASEVKVGKMIRKELEGFYDNRSSEWTYYYIWDSSIFIGQAISELIKNILVGSILASIILYIVFRSTKTMLVIALSIPVCIFTTLVMMSIFGFTINIISLLGLGIGVGMIVDACIVVLENIFRKIEEGIDRKEAILKGVSEVAGPVTSSIVTTIAVFVPIGFLDGMIGSMMRQMAITISISLIASLIVAFTVIPIISMYLIEKKKENRQKRRLLKIYEKLLFITLHHRWKTLALFVIILGASLFQLIAFVPKGYIPEVTERALYVRYQIDENTDFELNKQLLNSTADKILQIEGVSNVFYWTRKDNYTGSFYIHYDAIEDMKKSDSDVDEEVEVIINESVPYSFITLGAGQTDESGRMELSIRGSTMEAINRELLLIEQQLDLFDGVTGVEVSNTQSGEEWVIDFSRDQLAYYGQSRGEIERYVSLVLNGLTGIDIHVQGKQLKANILFPESIRSSSDALSNLSIMDDRNITLYDVANVDKRPAENARIRKDGLYYTVVTIYFDSAIRNQIFTQLQDYVNNDYKGDLLLSTMGREQDQQEAFQKLLLAMGVSLATVFLVLSIQFNRLRQPFLIICSLPFTMIGVSLGFIITNRTFDAMAMIGVIMLTGIVVNNAIVLIDFINKNRDQYTTLNEAILEGAKVRFRPIVTTTLTTVAGLIPMFIGATNTSDFQTPVATAVIFGLLWSILVSLLILPILYSLFEKKKIQQDKQIVAVFEM